MGTVEIPIVMVKNGTGPTVLFTGGVRGDEYEGAHCHFAASTGVATEQVQGRVIMMPAVTRLSPVDGWDINRCLPGNPKGTFSQMLAHFLDSVILPLADIYVDMHTAGHSFDSALSTNMHHVADAEIRRKTMAAAAAFGAPYNVVFGGVDEDSTFTSCVERRGIISLGTELGGWGRVNIEGVRIAGRGVYNILKHMDVIEGEPETGQKRLRVRPAHKMVRDPQSHVSSSKGGLFEPTHYVGEEVRAGEVAGCLHFVEDIDADPVVLTYGEDGIVWSGVGPGRVERGDAVAIVMEDYQDDWSGPAEC